MTSSNTNPFALPGFAQMGDATQNPMLASMEMMRHAWQNLAGAGAGAGALGGTAMVAPPMSLEELDRRINELRTVENWLRMNLSMLSSTIQGMEVQRATIATLKSFVSPAAEGGADAPSALEVALGLKPSGQAKIKHASYAPSPRSGGTSSSSFSASSSTFSSAAPESGTASVSSVLPGVGSADAWWGMLQQQFDSLATATAAGLKNAESVVASAGNAATTASKGAAATVSSMSSGLGQAVSGLAAQAKPARASKKTQAAEPGASRAAVKSTATSRAPRKRPTAPKSAS